MATIKELVDAFVANNTYSDWDHKVALEWLNATRCGGDIVRVLVQPVDELSAGEQRKRKDIRHQTLSFIGCFFDERPEVVQSIDALLAELGLRDEMARRTEFLPFKELYSSDEITVLLLKHLQPAQGRSRYTRADIAEYFLTSERTISGYIRDLLPAANPHDSAKVLGQSVQMDPHRGTNELESTTHPLFLPLNMLELYTLVDTLVSHVNDPVEGRIVKALLEQIYSQTTDYARNRLAHIHDLDRALAPIPHLEDSRNVGEAVLFSEKEQLVATVRYMDQGVEKVCTGHIWRNRRDKKKIDVSDGESVCHIPYRDIISLEPARE